MDTGSFYHGGASFSSSTQSRDDGSGRYSSQSMASVFETPPSRGLYHPVQDPLVSIQQKLDQMMCMFMSQKAATEKGIWGVYCVWVHTCMSNSDNE